MMGPQSPHPKMNLIHVTKDEHNK